MTMQTSESRARSFWDVLNGVGRKRMRLLHRQGSTVTTTANGMRTGSTADLRERIGPKFYEALHWLSRSGVTSISVRPSRYVSLARAMSEVLQMQCMSGLREYDPAMMLWPYDDDKILEQKPLDGYRIRGV